MMATNTIHFLYNKTAGELSEGRFGPHPEVPAGWDSIAIDLHEIPPWFPHHAAYEGGKLREMTPQEKTAADAGREEAERTHQFNANKALHAVFKVFLKEINLVRAEVGLQALDANEVRSRIKAEFDLL